MELRSLTAVMLFFCCAAQAQTQTQTQTQTVEVTDGWVRSTVKGQQSTGAFMKITSKEAMRLVDVSSPAAGIAEVHQMKMEGDILKMRAAPSLDLAAGGTMEFKPGGYHVMLMDLKQPFATGSKVALTLTFRDARGGEKKLDVTLPVSAAAPGKAPAKASEKPDHSHKH